MLPLSIPLLSRFHNFLPPICYRLFQQHYMFWLFYLQEMHKLMNQVFAYGLQVFVDIPRLQYNVSLQLRASIVLFCHTLYLFYFICPKISIGFGQMKVFAIFMTMPKAIVYENDCSAFAKHQIRMAGKVLVLPITWLNKNLLTIWGIVLQRFIIQLMTLTRTLRFNRISLYNHSL